MHDQELPTPDFFDPDKVSNVWRVPYQERADAARQWTHRHYISNAAHDRNRIGLLLVDVQNTFCIPGFELYVGGESGTGAVDDNRRLLEDCTSPVVIPDVINYAGQADEAFQRFAQAGMHIVQSTEPMTAWPDFPC